MKLKKYFYILVIIAFVLLLVTAIIALMSNQNTTEPNQQEIISFPTGEVVFDQEGNPQVITDTESSSDIGISLSKREYTSTEDIEAIITNRTDSSYRLVGSIEFDYFSQWKTVLDLSCDCGNVCTDLMVEANNTKVLTANLQNKCFTQPELSAGDYRVVVLVYKDDSIERLIEEFKITD